MFEKASRLKLRFSTPQGPITIEDLWDIPLTSAVGRANLNDIAKSLNKTLKSEDEDFVTVNKKSNTNEQIAFEIVKHIIAARVAEDEARRAVREKKEKKQQILALIAQKETEQLAGTSLDELRKMAEEL